MPRRRNLWVTDMLQWAPDGSRSPRTRCGIARLQHCPKCQTNARNQWLADRDKELLPVKYVHVVFTIPHELVVAGFAEQESRL